jgi:broad specificity phosphatase PhoE
MKGIILMRHAERLDRAMEEKGEDWISTASRPQDTPLSDYGVLQAKEVGKQLQQYKVSKIYTSPLIRTVQTADLVADVLELGDSCIHIEHGLVEEAKSFRGKKVGEPKPSWNPLILPLSELINYSSRINCECTESIVTVTHEYDETLPNTVREVHETLTDLDDVTHDRCRKFINHLQQSNFNDYILCVGHGASTSGCIRALQKDLSEELHIKGSRNVSSWALFVPLDAANPMGPWYAPSGTWEEGGNVLSYMKAADRSDDQGDQTLPV